MLQEWEDIHQGARADTGILSTEINHAVGEDAVLVHHVFENSDALVHYFSTTATEHLGPLTAVAKPDLHLVRGLTVPADAGAWALFRPYPLGHRPRHRSDERAPAVDQLLDRRDVGLGQMPQRESAYADTQQQEQRNIVSDERYVAQLRIGQSTI